ncbi:hypothetical protein ZIOFF_056259 [Zingiber officinale]|uniref:Uncharacterized protein n=1 Tax=Zingiber officinale TaxID=94328 RepID=A0A8J5KKY1_ZINOF|nr:hypothetical protein ZIOFF_056259 [Zingiber officinale]
MVIDYVSGNGMFGIGSSAFSKGNRKVKVVKVISLWNNWGWTSRLKNNRSISWLTITDAPESIIHGAEISKPHEKAIISLHVCATETLRVLDDGFEFNSARSCSRCSFVMVLTVVIASFAMGKIRPFFSPDLPLKLAVPLRMFGPVEVRAEPSMIVVGPFLPSITFLWLSSLLTSEKTSPRDGSGYDRTQDFKEAIRSTALSCGYDEVGVWIENVLIFFLLLLGVPCINLTVYGIIQFASLFQLRTIQNTSKLAAVLASFILRKLLEKHPFEKAAIKTVHSQSLALTDFLQVLYIYPIRFITKHQKDYVDLHRIRL